MLKLYRTQMLAFLSNAHAEMGNRDLAMQSLKEFDQSEQSKSLDSQRMIVPALGELKLFDRMLASIDVQLRTSEHRSMYSYVRLSIDRCTATYSEHRSMYS